MWEFAALSSSKTKNNPGGGANRVFYKKCQVAHSSGSCFLHCAGQLCIENILLFFGYFFADADLQSVPTDIYILLRRCS